MRVEPNAPQCDVTPTTRLWAGVLINLPIICTRGTSEDERQRDRARLGPVTPFANKTDWTT